MEAQEAQETDRGEMILRQGVEMTRQLVTRQQETLRQTQVLGEILTPRHLNQQQSPIGVTNE